MAKPADDEAPPHQEPPSGGAGGAAQPLEGRAPTMVSTLRLLRGPKCFVTV